MNVTLSFNEIKDIILKKTNGKVDLDFTYVDYRTVKVSYKPMSFLPAVNINIMVAKVDNSQLVLSYNANNAIDMVIRGLVAFLDNNIPKEIVELDTSTQCICIHLNKIEQLQKPMEMMEIHDVFFSNDKVCIETQLKL